jgi:serine/threonine protein kinase
MLASLSHPNIVGILDQGRTADGSFFLVTDFVEGCSLDVYLKRIELDLPAVLRLFVTIAQAVDEIHRNGIVHRDLKPKNIIVDNRGEPHVLDFGLARPLKDDLAQASQEHLTLIGQVVGSLPWSSPEQVGGNAMRVDQRTDVYALGIMLYEATTCSFPYPIDGGLPGLAQHILHSPPITPHFVIKCDSPPTIQLFESVLMKSLAKSPADRHQSAGLLARDLESCLTAQYSARRVQLSGKSLLRATCVAAIAGTMLSTKGSTPVSFSASVGPTASARRIPFIEPTVFSLPSFTNSLGMRLVRIPAGNGRVGDLRSQHGSSDSERPRIIRINAPFFIAVTVVTQQQYSKLFHTDPSYPNFKGPNFPVNGVSWDQTLDFCRSLSFEERRHYRLPTEIEWEYACRAGGPGEFGGYARPDDMGWYRENSGVCLHSVALKAPNPWGLYDMNGNVWQWCSFDHTDLVSSRTSVSDENRIAKGGSFQDASFNCRSASRCLFSHQLKDRTIGFRVVCDLD